MGGLRGKDTAVNACSSLVFVAVLSGNDVAVESGLRTNARQVCAASCAHGEDGT